MSDPYCPPPGGEDYLEGGIVYPIPVGKEATRALDNTHNDIINEEPKSIKDSSANLADKLETNKPQKFQTNISTSISLKSEKVASQLSATQTRVAKTSREILPSGFQRSKKAVNII